MRTLLSFKTIKLPLFSQITDYNKLQLCTVVQITNVDFAGSIPAPGAQHSSLVSRIRSAIILHYVCSLLHIGAA
jgi:hypothetical protein